ncbi:MAG TPA: ArsA family ATPase, partial [Vicinamibacterales bacterium]|nr:ArsA family ATPase [Vicinamibacterales bacterium]
MRFAFYGGKGGVGKTTCAAARALAEASEGGVLIISTDPAHSLGDALGLRLRAEPRRVRRGLDAAELDGTRAFARWLGEHRPALGDILEHGTWLDRADVDAMLDLSLPGIDELVGLIEIERLAAAGPHRLVVVDTAPTGHTLRLLSAPGTVAAVADLLDALQEEHRTIRARFGRSRKPEAADILIALVAEQASAAANRLRDRRTTFHWVTLAEPMSTAECRDGVAALERSGIRVAELIVNRVIPPGSRPCPICDRRRAEQQREIRGITRALGRARRLRVIPAGLEEPRGVPALTRIGEVLTGRPPSICRLPPSAGRGMHFSLPAGAAAIQPASLRPLRGARMLFFGGKGGVGKTTVAASAAIALARADPHKRLLLLSTDPAHSIAAV